VLFFVATSRLFVSSIFVTLALFAFVQTLVGTVIEAQVRGLGGTPAQGGSVSGSMHRAWTNIKSAITGMNEHAVLAECERGEDAAKHAYEGALKQDLPTDVRTIIERQYQGVKENHDRVRNLRNAAV
jgi:uncharacterized protein (TIGR02284 family)